MHLPLITESRAEAWSPVQTLRFGNEPILECPSIIRNAKATSVWVGRRWEIWVYVAIKQKQQPVEG